MHVADSIEQTFRLHLDAFAKFRDLLLREHTALKQRNYQAINACFVEHAQLVDDLEKLDRSFKAALAKVGASHAAASVEIILAALPEFHRSRLQSMWGNLLSVAEECRDQSTVNHRLISLNRQSTEAALRILKGQITPPDNTYSPAGKVSATLPNAAIAIA